MHSAGESLYRRKSCVNNYLTKMCTPLRVVLHYGSFGSGEGSFSSTFSVGVCFRVLDKLFQELWSSTGLNTPAASVGPCVCRARTPVRQSDRPFVLVLQQLVRLCWTCVLSSQQPEMRLSGQLTKVKSPWTGWSGLTAAHAGLNPRSCAGSARTLCPRAGENCLF